MLPNKIKTFHWLLTLEKFPTNVYLIRIGMNVNPHCHFCEKKLKTTSHIFFQYKNAIHFWEKMQIKSGVQFVQQINQLTCEN